MRVGLRGGSDGRSLGRGGRRRGRGSEQVRLNELEREKGGGSRGWCWCALEAGLELVADVSVVR